MHERQLRGEISQVYETLNINPDYTIPSLKGELTLVVSPYKQQYNRDLLEECQDLDIEEAKRRMAGDRSNEIDKMLDREYQVFFIKEIFVLQFR